MEKPTKDMSFAEFSSLRQRKINAQESAASTLADVKASSEDKDQSNQNPQAVTKRKLQWSQNRGYSQLSVAVAVGGVCLWGLQVAMSMLLKASQMREGGMALLLDALWWTHWLSVGAAGLDMGIFCAFHLTNLIRPSALSSWDCFVTIVYLAAVGLAGPKLAGSISLLRLCKVMIHMKIVDQEHSDEVSHLSDQLRQANTAAKNAKNQLNQATTKWRHEVQTKERAEIQLRQYKDEVMMLQEALVIASKDMAKMQVLAGVAQEEDEAQQPASGEGAAADDISDSADLRAEAKELLYAYIDDLGHSSVELSEEDEDTLVSMLVQASEVGIRTRIDKFMQAANKPKRPRRKIVIREDGAFKTVQ